MDDSDAKYITFKRDEFLQMVGQWSADHMMGTTNVAQLMDDIDGTEISDAVVIRRQDYFAAPALAGYADALAIVIKLTDDSKQRNELLRVADYFQRQAELAAEEGWKTPDV